MFPSFVFLGREFSMYAIMSVIGLLISGLIFCKRIKKEEQDDTEAILFLTVLSVGMLIGGHILYAAVSFRSYYRFGAIASIADLLRILTDLFGGMVFYGGLIGAYLLGITYASRRRLNVALYMDNSALFAPIFHSFARIGCFFGGCCYGIESTFGFSASGNTLTDIGEVCRFPVQLLESALNLLIALVIFYILKKGKLKGQAFYIYLLLYAIIRFFDEFLRGDEVRGFIFGLSTSQFISIFVELFAIVMLILTTLKKHQKCNS